MLVLTRGELPPPWIRLAFLPVALSATAGGWLVLSRTTAEIAAGRVEAATAASEMTDGEHATAAPTIERLHRRAGVRPALP